MKKESLIVIVVMFFIILIFVIMFISNKNIDGGKIKIGFVNNECKVEAEKYQINSYEECNTKNCIEFCNLNRVCCPGYDFNDESVKNDSSIYRGLMNNGLLYEVYPKTDHSPELDFKWIRELKKSGISRTTPYGVWKPVGGWAPSYGIQLLIIDGEDPIYAISNGTIVYLDREEKIMSIRSGTNYAIIMNHIINIPMELRKGLTVKQGDIIGYTEVIKNEGIWDLQVIKREGNLCRTKSPIELFNNESKIKLQFILESGSWEYQRSTKKWTVNDGINWITDLENDEWWANCELLGLSPGTYSETEEDFLINSPISKIMREGYKAVRILD